MNWELIVLAVGAAVPITAAAIGFIQFSLARRDVIKERRFENYHALVRIIAGINEEPLSSQIAAAFELRNYPEYKDVTTQVYDRNLVSLRHAGDTVKDALKQSIDYLEKR